MNTGHTQLSLLDTGAGFRRTDPPSSRRAARRQDRGGTRSVRQGDMARVLEAVRTAPGLSSRQLAERFGLDRYMVARRLPDLQRKALVDVPRDGDGNPIDDGGDRKWFPTAEALTGE